MFIVVISRCRVGESLFSFYTFCVFKILNKEYALKKKRKEKKKNSSWSNVVEFKKHDRRIYSSHIPKEQYIDLSKKNQPSSLSKDIWLV